MRRNLPVWAERPGNIPGLDGLRALSVLMVMASHMISERIPGGLGVYVFFVISGFLIAHLMFAEEKRSGHISLRNFYLRRALRLYPALVAFVAVISAYCIVIAYPLTGEDIASALLYFANYHRSRPFGILWSLSVEEHFYFLFPAVMVVLRAKPRAIIAAAVAVCVGCLALRLAVAATIPELLQGELIYARTEFRLDAIAYGVLVAAVFRTVRGRDVLYRISHPLFTVAALLVVLLCLGVRDPYFRETLRYSLLGLSIAVIVAGVLFRPTAATKLLDAPLLVWIGKLSYSLYLWHYFVKFAFETQFPELRTELFSPLLMAISIGAAAISYYGLEQPMQNLRKRLSLTSGAPHQKRPATSVEVGAPVRAAE